MRPIKKTTHPPAASTKTKGRITPLDFTRGLAIIVMVLFHLFYTFGEVFHFALFERLFLFFDATILVDLFAGLFIIIAGISSNLSSSNIYRGLKTLSVAMVITFVTAVLLPRFGYENLGIYFGILHFMSVAMLISPLLLKLAERIPPAVAVPICALLFLFTWNIQNGILGLPLIKATISIPDSLRSLAVLYPFGIGSIGIKSVDIYPIFPWIFLFTIGIYAGKALPRLNLPERCYKPISRPIELAGRHTLAIYVAHQPVIFLIALLLDKLF